MCLAERGLGTCEAKVQQRAGGGVFSPQDGAVEDLRGGLRILQPGGLVGEVVAGLQN